MARATLDFGSLMNQIVNADLDKQWKQVKAVGDATSKIGELLLKQKMDGIAKSEKKLAEQKADIQKMYDMTQGNTVYSDETTIAGAAPSKPMDREQFTAAKMAGKPVIASPRPIPEGAVTREVAGPTGIVRETQDINFKNRSGAGNRTMPITPSASDIKELSGIMKGVGLEVGKTTMVPESTYNTYMRTKMTEFAQAGRGGAAEEKTRLGILNYYAKITENATDILLSPEERGYYQGIKESLEPLYNQITKQFEAKYAVPPEGKGPSVVTDKATVSNNKGESYQIPRSQLARFLKLNPTFTEQ